MAQSGLITDPNRWFSFIEAKNKSSHTYDEEIAEKVYKVDLVNIRNLAPSYKTDVLRERVAV